MTPQAYTARQLPAGKRPFGVHGVTSTPVSPAVGPIASMMVNVQLQSPASGASPKRLRLDQEESDSRSEHVVPMVPHLNHSLQIKQDKRANLEGEIDQSSRKRHKAFDCSPYLGETGNKNNTQNEQSEFASAVALASLAFSGNKKTSEVQTRGEDLNSEREMHPSTREMIKSPLKPVPVSPDQPRPANKTKKVNFESKLSKVLSPPTFDHPHNHNSMPPPNMHRYHDARSFQYSHPWHASNQSQRNSFMPPLSPQVRQPARIPVQKKAWVCDFCNVASFARYEDACAHEEQCKHRFQSRADETRNASTDANRPPHRESAYTGSVREMERDGCREDVEKVSETAEHTRWGSGSVSLCVEASDTEWLSEVNCFIRKHCVEAFSAEVDDVARTSKRGRIALHQVGIRCKFCASVHLHDRAVGAVSFPTSVAGIYESVKRWQKCHLSVCEAVPEEIKNKITQLRSDASWVPTTRQYWADSAKSLGMIDTSDGIRFGRDPRSSPVVVTPSRPPSKTEAESTNSDKVSEGGHIVIPSDQELVPPYVYFLMRQVHMCRFTEADRFVARSKGPVGFAGFQCRHCAGHAGLGKYYPASSKRLATNSTSQNIHAHILKCRKCPVEIKRELELQKSQKLKLPGLTPGWRRTFFEKVWDRLHGGQS